MRTALTPPNRGYKRSSTVLPAPVRGWNTKDPLSMTEPGFAVLLDNFIITPNAIEVRKPVGLVTAIPGGAQSIFSYDYNDMKKILAAGDGKIYDCDIANNTYKVLLEGLTGNHWQEVFYEGHKFLFNGVDLPKDYHNGEIANAQFTQDGLDLRRLIGGVVYKNRIFMLERGTLKFHYTEEAGNVAGPILPYDLAQMSQLGGELMLAATMTYAAAAGAQETQLVFITSQGEAFVYAGDNPSDADNWALRGVYRVPKPLSYRCADNVGGDIGYASQEGYFLLSNLFSTPVSTRAVTFSDAINNYVTGLKNSFDNFGWEVKNFRAGNMLIVNAPVQNSDIEQHVMNTQTGSWSRFKKIEALSWAFLGLNAYFCGKDGIYKYDTPSKENIDWRFELAYTNMNIPEAKIIKEIQLFIQAYKSLTFTLLTAIDFAKTTTSAQPSATGRESKWDISPWDTTPWATEAKALVKRIIPRMKAGQYFSFGMAGRTSNQDVRFINMNVFFEHGKNLV